MNKYKLAQARNFEEAQKLMDQGYKLVTILKGSDIQELYYYLQKKTDEQAQESFWDGSY